MNSFNLFGFGWDRYGWSVALGVVTIAGDKDSPKCLLGFAYDKHTGYSLDLFWRVVF